MSSSSYHHLIQFVCLIYLPQQSVRLISLCNRLSRSFLSRSNMSVARSDDTLVRAHSYTHLSRSLLKTKLRHKMFFCFVFSNCALKKNTLSSDTPNKQKKELVKGTTKHLKKTMIRLVTAGEPLYPRGLDWSVFME